MPDAAKRIRVVHVVPGSIGHRFSGITRRLYSLLSGWQDPHITFDLWGTDVKPVNMNSGDPRFKLPQGSILWSDPRRANRPSRAWEAIRLLATLTSRRREFDIAHIHYSTWGALASPVVLHLLRKRAIYHMTLYGSDNPGSVLQQKRGRLAFSLLRRFDGIVAVSPRLAEDCRKHGLRRVLCLPNFLSTPPLEGSGAAVARESLRRELAVPQGAVILLFVGSAIDRKGVDLLAECFARLAPHHPELWLAVVGPQGRADDPEIDEVFVKCVKETISRAGADSRTVWAGLARDGDALSRYYAAADIFVFPTRAEGLPNVLIDAAAAGLPSVATSLPGSTDYIVKDGESGLLFPPGDVEALASAVDRLVSDASLRARMGEAARARSREFGFEGYVRCLRAFYVDVTGRAA